MRRQRGAALAEFAVTWPLMLLTVLGATELAIWSVEAAAARSAALAGAQAGSVAGATSATAAGVALIALRPAVVGIAPAAWCPGAGAQPAVWVCAADRGTSMEVMVGGSVPALVPLVPGRAGLPLGADARIPKEVFG
jgi:hypothetical protein